MSPPLENRSVTICAVTSHISKLSVSARICYESLIQNLPAIVRMICYNQHRLILEG